MVAQTQDEERRLRLLRAYRLVERPADDVLEGIARAALRVSGCATALVTLLEEERMRFLALAGNPMGEPPRSITFCNHILGASEPMIVPDALEDPRFRDSPLVTAAPALRFYAGFPLNAPEGPGLGTLCVVDTEPSALSDEQLETLTWLAQHAQSELERRRAVRDERKSRWLLESVLDHIPVMVFLKDADSLEVTHWNREAESISGVSRAELVGMTGYESFPSEEMKGFHERDRRVIDDREVVENEESLTGPRGTRDLVTRKVPLIDPEGEASCLLGISSDITELRRRDRELETAALSVEELVKKRTAELLESNHLLREMLDERNRALDALKQTQEQFLRAQKLEALGRLAGGVAHDFNNLIMVIRSYTELAGMASTPKQAADDLRVVLDASDRAAVLVRQLLAFSRRDVRELTVIDLNDVVGDARDILQRLIGVDITVAAELSPDLGDVRADEGQLEQVLFNLAINARDAMPSGGTLTLHTYNLLDDDGDWVVLDVADTGFGMDAETADRVFEPFFTTKEPDRGTGLGLSTVYGIVKQSGGRVHVDSAVGEGSTFRVMLPRISAAQVERDVDDNDGRAADVSGDELVLIVEDNEMLAQASARMLEGEGYRPLVATSPEDGLVLAAAQPIDLLVVDLLMPGTDGVEVAEQVRAIRPDLPCIFMSGYADETIAERGLVLGAAEVFLRKPFSKAQFLAKVFEQLERRRRSRR